LVGCTLEDDNGWKPYSHGPHENFKEHDLPPKLQGNILQHVIFFRDVNMKDRIFFFLAKRKPQPLIDHIIEHPLNTVPNTKL